MGHVPKIKTEDIQRYISNITTFHFVSAESKQYFMTNIF